ncbi:hypothetical protein [Riemerella anatipestifer]|uniref:GIY-YIG domain-containing protein n=2 Tax=Riemerella anatipestifer TaxID=34085 RepID=J9QZI9_RIEAN|nr:hypothetical protein [Riemerella anatipestifer]AFC37702.1 hypothetical protein [Riemerella anatipestifer]AFR36075.1 hypothetical protein B739_1482 [Riemerella anatipestifer RA-CH-1]MBT0549433.1 hypothetical protein [Riemerella anatipestifer]MBT0556666.1 hypothetical protein [Riemerella anatipestifer]MBT0560196.1 hypothetical protein [Riemerella anatipestifer]
MLKDTIIENTIIDEYVNRKILFYKDLKKNYKENIKIHNSLIINKDFIKALEEEFSDFLKLRENSKKIPRKENETFKTNLIKRFDRIKEIKENSNKPTIYWFEIINKSNLSNEKIQKKFKSSKKANSGWWTVVNKGADIETKILYLGKVEKNLFGRFLQHLGIGHKKTSSLKLRKWFAQFEDIDLEFKYVQFDNDVLPYLEDLENIYWRYCKPLLGQEPKIK